MILENMPLFSSFVQIDGISKNKEEKLWNEGIDTLYDLQIDYQIQQSFFDEDDNINLFLSALKNQNPSPFIEKLEKKEYYRIAYSFPEKVLFLDIETTGLSRQYHYITMIGWMINGKYGYWVQGTSTDDFFNAIKSCSMIVTFNGINFDCKFLDSYFNTDIFSTLPNIDLMHLCRRYGLTGGQKKIEEFVSFNRPSDLKSVNGKEAIALWYEFLFGNNDSLNRLIKYNYYDVVGMTYILDWIFFNKIYGIVYPKLNNSIIYHFYNHRDKIPTIEYSITVFDEIRYYIKMNISSFDEKALSVSKKYRIVGIDLAGKTTSRTGVCLLEDNHAITRVLHTNDEIIEYVTTNKPDLISIDAPLSLPKGRTSVYDDDPKREEAGILRYCERELKKRNVNCYPALIRSMQELTKRGIEIANYFRSLGFPVIECFPGATQDIIQLPRKRTDESLLKEGLSRFGINGVFKNSNVCHDELDAITASIVGQFFISGYFEALGIPEENDMIIPQKKRCNNSFDIVIGVCGPISSGKTEASKYISNKGFKYCRYSQILANDLSEKDIQINRTSLQREGWNFYNNSTQYDLNKILKSKLSDCSCVVIDGLRHMEDYTFWKEQCFKRFYLFYIESDYNIREQRYIQDQKDDINYSDVLKHPVESHVEDLKNRADYVIDNNDAIDKLYQQIDSILENIISKKKRS